MTPKEQYETRKAERKKLDDLEYQVAQRTKDVMMLDTIDRFVTAVERIADAVEREPKHHHPIVGCPYCQRTFDASLLKV